MALRALRPPSRAKPFYRSKWFYRITPLTRPLPPRGGRGASDRGASGTRWTVADTLRLVLNVWRQPRTDAPGKLVRYELPAVSIHMSFLEMLDVLNEQLTARGEDPLAFDHDCREGICGTCGFLIDGVAHGPLPLTTVCQLHMRHFKDGAELTLEPWRSRAFPVVKDLAVNRGAFDRIVAAGGY